MANINASQVKELREKTGAPMMDCKNALTESKGDIEGAVVLQRGESLELSFDHFERVDISDFVCSRDDRPEAEKCIDALGAGEIGSGALSSVRSHLDFGTDRPLLGLAAV